MQIYQNLFCRFCVLFQFFMLDTYFIITKCILELQQEVVENSVENVENHV